MSKWKTALPGNNFAVSVSCPLVALQKKVRLEFETDEANRINEQQQDVALRILEKLDEPLLERFLQLAKKKSLDIDPAFRIKSIFIPNLKGIVKDYVWAISLEKVNWPTGEYALKNKGLVVLRERQQHDIEIAYFGDCFGVKSPRFPKLDDWPSFLFQAIAE